MDESIGNWRAHSQLPLPPLNPRHSRHLSKITKRAKKQQVSQVAAPSANTTVEGPPSHNILPFPPLFPPFALGPPEALDGKIQTPVEGATRRPSIKPPAPPQTLRSERSPAATRLVRAYVGKAPELPSESQKRISKDFVTTDHLVLHRKPRQIEEHGVLQSLVERGEQILKQREAELSAYVSAVRQREKEEEEWLSQGWPDRKLKPIPKPPWLVRLQELQAKWAGNSTWGRQTHVDQSVNEKQLHWFSGLEEPAEPHPWDYTSPFNTADSFPLLPDALPALSFSLGRQENEEPEKPEPTQSPEPGLLDQVVYTDPPTPVEADVESFPAAEEETEPLPDNMTVEEDEAPAEGTGQSLQQLQLQHTQQQLALRAQQLELIRSAAKREQRALLLAALLGNAQ